jgi:hypothetical protein
MSQLATTTDALTEEGRASGFRANLSGASLPDLVQMECLARSHTVFRVTSGGSVGYLHFRGGEIVHAASGDNVGEPAALEILNWRGGTFDACGASEEPEVPTIRSHWQHLLLRAAQSRDESGRHRLVDFPKQVSPEEAKPSSGSQQRQSDMNADAIPSGFGSVPQLAVRVDQQGAVLSSKGDVSEFAPMAAYAARLAHLVGSDLGMDSFVGLECITEQRRVLVHIDKAGHLLAVQAGVEVDVSALRARFGL